MFPEVPREDKLIKSIQEKWTEIRNNVEVLIPDDRMNENSKNLG